MAVGNAGLVATSTDGVTWQERNAVVSQTLEDVAYGNGLYVAVGWPNGVIVTSPDSVTWSCQ